MSRDPGKFRPLFFPPNYHMYLAVSFSQAFATNIMACRAPQSRSAWTTTTLIIYNLHLMDLHPKHIRDVSISHHNHLRDERNNCQIKILLLFLLVYVTCFDSSLRVSMRVPPKIITLEHSRQLGEKCKMQGYQLCFSIEWAKPRKRNTCERPYSTPLCKLL